MYSPKAGKQTAIDKSCNLRERCRTEERNNPRTSPQQSDCLSQTSGHFGNRQKTSQPLDPFLAERSVASWKRQAWRAGSVNREVRNLRRGWAGAAPRSAPQPVTSWSCATIAWTSAVFGRTLSVSHHLPSLGRLPPCGWSGRPSSSWSRHSPVTASPLRCRTGLSAGCRGSGRPTPWSPQGGLLPAGTCWTLWQIGRGLQRHWKGIGGRGLFVPQLTYLGSSWEQGSQTRANLRTSSVSLKTT